MNHIQNQTLSSIALNHLNAIPVMEKYQLDFCCRGNKTLSEVCTEKKLDTERIEKEIEEACTNESQDLSFGEMSPGQLVSYILARHHAYARNAIPVILNHLGKIESKHGERFPYIGRVFKLFSSVRSELDAHFEKEENILFPRIIELDENSKQGSALPYDPASFNAPLRIMELEHDQAGQILYAIRAICNNYVAPDTACTTHKICLEELKEFELDLHQHVHLENNILFPKVRALLQETRA